MSQKPPVTFNRPSSGSNMSAGVGQLTQAPNLAVNPSWFPLTQGGLLQNQ